MKVLLFGHNGWIGGQLAPILSSVGLDVIDAGNTRADDEHAVAELLDSTKPDRVVSVIGRTRGPGIGTIDFLEDAEKEHDKLVLNIRDNLFGPMTLAIACSSRKIHFTYLGTGCIFTSPKPEEDRGFTEEDSPNFFGSAYSVVKGYTDRLMRQLHDNENGILQARIRMPITPDRSPFNFVTKIVKYDKICSIENSMTVLPTLLPLLADMILNGMAGTVNLTNPGTISHDRILALYKSIVDKDFTWSTFSMEEQDKLLLSKRSNNRLDTSKLSIMYPDVPDIETAITKCLVEMSIHGSI